MKTIKGTNSVGKKPARRAGNKSPKSARATSLASILVPIDFSDESKHALRYAATMAAAVGAKLTLLHVVEPITMSDFEVSFPLVVENNEQPSLCKRRLERLAKDLKIPAGRIGKLIVRSGRSYNEINEGAKALKSDLIIIATHGYSGLKHVLLGSVAERVVRHAPCPVLVVRSTNGAPEKLNNR